MNMNSIRLHGLSPYDRSGKVRWLLTELGLKFEDRWLSRENKEIESPEFLKINPLGRVPAIELGKQTLFESGAICAYLADLHLDQGLAPPLSSPERAEYQKWMYFAASTLDVFQTRIMIIEDIPLGKVQEDKLITLQTDLRDAMGALHQILSQSAYLVGNRFTAADICVSYHLFWCKLWPELQSIMQEFPDVLTYLSRMESRPSAVKSDVFSYRE